MIMSDLNKKKEAVRAIKFSLFSASAGIIELSVASLLDWLTDWKYWPCYLIALICSVIWNFTLNRQFTFQSANNVPIAMAKVLLFYAVFTPTSTYFVKFLTENLGWPGVLATGLNMACNLVLEFLYDRFFVFRDSIDTNERAQKKKN